MANKKLLCKLTLGGYMRLQVVLLIEIENIHWPKIAWCTCTHLSPKLGLGWKPCRRRITIHTQNLSDTTSLNKLHSIFDPNVPCSVKWHKHNLCRLHTLMFGDWSQYIIHKLRNCNVMETLLLGGCKIQHGGYYYWCSLGMTMFTCAIGMEWMCQVNLSGLVTCHVATICTLHRWTMDHKP